MLCFFCKNIKEPGLYKPNHNANTINQCLTTKLTVFNKFLLTFCSFSERYVKFKNNNGQN